MILLFFSVSYHTAYDIEVYPHTQGTMIGTGTDKQVVGPIEWDGKEIIH